MQWTVKDMVLQLLKDQDGKTEFLKQFYTCKKKVPFRLDLKVVIFNHESDSS